MVQSNTNFFGGVPLELLAVFRSAFLPHFLSLCILIIMGPLVQQSILILLNLVVLIWLSMNYLLHKIEGWW